MSLFAYPLVLRAACMADKIVLQAKKHEVARLEHALSKHEATDKLQRETLGCISRHWCALTEELKGTLQRLDGRWWPPIRLLGRPRVDELLTQ